jgi:hypothetical protein
MNSIVDKEMIKELGLEDNDFLNVVEELEKMIVKKIEIDGK